MKLSTWLSLLLYVLAGIGLYAYLLYGETNEFPNWETDKSLILTVGGTSLLAGILMRGLSTWFHVLLPWRKYFGFRFLAELVVRTLLVGVIVLTLSMVFLGTLDFTELKDFVVAQTSLLLKTAVVSLFLNLVFIVASFTFFAYEQFAVVQIQSVEIKRKQLQLQFDMLRNQLSPHYLFNCLNTISNLVYKDAELAEEFVRRFAHTYQYVLDTHKKDLIPISEEIEFVNAYAFLLQTRFSNNIKLIINLSSEAKESLIPPLTLQLLVENAVKHNTISDEHPLQIEVYQEAERLCVKNTISETPKQVSSLKVGLENIKKRYEYFTPTELELLNGENFEVKLPILKARKQALV
ncbi:MAG: hypothetical protein ACJAWV_000443 [Flammeovirgaceae bacterium]|jgi:two-component system LytT family sensor kinase